MGIVGHRSKLLDAIAALHEEAAHGQQLLTQRYGLLKIVGDFFSRLMRHKQTVIAVEVG